MSADDRRTDIEARLRRLRADFDNYEKAVTLIASLERWIEYKWGPQGEIARTLESFDRFPRCGELRPDFLATFSTGYRLCGEVVRTFRGGPQSGSDLRQIVGYTSYLRQTSLGGPCGDVLLLVHPYSDDTAAKTVADAFESDAEDAKPQAPIVILSYMLDQGANGDWYLLNWRPHAGNSRFSDTNAVGAGEADLNALIVDISHCAIQVDPAAVDIFTRNPLINDAPPPIYTMAMIIYPAILTELLTDEERDELYAGAVIHKRVSRESLLATTFVSTMDPPAGRHLRDGLEFMVDHDFATRVSDTDPAEFAVRLSVRILSRDLKESLGERIVRFDIARLLRQRRRAARRAPRNQLKLFQT